MQRVFSNSYLQSAAIVAAVTLVGVAIDRVLQSPNVEMLYLLTVLVSGLRWGRRTGIFTALLSTFVFVYCFVPPRYSFAITDLSFVVIALGFVAVAIAMSELAGRTRQLTTEHAARTIAEARSQAKDEILNKIAHEMRAPLTVLMGRMQMLGQGDAEADRLSRNLPALEQSARLLARLIDDLLSAARINSGKLPLTLEPMPLSPVVVNAVDAMQAIADAKGVTLKSAIAATGEILGDAQRIHQVVVNLLSNAIKFTPEGGEVSVRLVRAADAAVLTVSDTGVGIPAPFLPHVFEQFSQSDAQHAHGGLGLGLAIVKHLVAAHGGTIFVTSDGEGRGTSFTIELPTIAAVATARQWVGGHYSTPSPTGTT